VDAVHHQPEEIILSSFTEALGAFLSDVGASLQEFVDTVSTKDEAATAQAATVPTQARQQAPAANRAPARNMTRVRLDVDVAHDGPPQALLREFEDYARTHGRSTDASALVSFLQSRQGVTPRSWSAPDYAGYGSRR
jgi:hypothetical protein